ncbi:MAG: AAA family ATPase, partial [Alphaproteobacteria bacterium]
MRLAELALKRFGRFEDRSLDFGPADGLDLHLIYGPNEAGKSTLFAAMEDLFFGIPSRSRHAFRFEQSNLRVEGEVEAPDASRRRVVRVHDRKAALRDVHEAPLPESVFGPALERLDRATYRQMFSLDEQSLRDGARALLDSEGDAAEILFGSSLGLAQASRNLKAMRDEADKLYRW